jgi:transposase-like protein
MNKQRRAYLMDRSGTPILQIAETLRVSEDQASRMIQAERKKIQRRIERQEGHPRRRFRKR